MTDIYEEMESAVRSYCRQFPTEFVSAKGSLITDKKGKTYIDFLSGCGALNYGHNDESLKAALLKYIGEDNLAMSLDMHSTAKSEFLERFRDLILAPRGLNYRVQFTGPTGTNSVEASIKLARKITGRTSIVAFTNGFHGCTLGSLSLTGSGCHRQPALHSLAGTTRHPYDGYLGSEIDTSHLLNKLLDDPSSGVDAPAAIILETIQGEGGLNCASSTWLKNISDIAKRHGALLIIDDIQAGCGRSGSFFSFEDAGINPDIVTMSKSLSGFGLPMAIALIKPDLDVWKPGEHNGTFRGNNHAFVTASAALSKFWSDGKLQETVSSNGDYLRSSLQEVAQECGYKVKGRGYMLGIDTQSPELAAKVRAKCFDSGVIIELCGPRDEVIKLMPALTIDRDLLGQGIKVINTAVLACQ